MAKNKYKGNQFERKSSSNKGEFKDARKNDYFKKTGKDVTDSKHLTNSCNDPSWYFADPAIARDVSSVPFNQMAGVPFSLGTPISSGNTFNSTSKYVIPGMMVFWMNPSVGYSNDPSSPINVGANSLYTWTRYMNSGATNYGATDEMIFCIAMANIYACINYYMRGYGLACTYAYQNRYLPDAVIDHIAPVSASNMRNSMADYRAMVNIFINKTASFAVPATINYFRRASFLYSNYYIEGPSVKDQMYAFAPNAFYKFSRTAEGLPQLVLTTAPVGKTMSEATAFLNSLIAPLISDEAFNTISGDIKKAFGEANLVRLTQLPETYILPPVFEIGVLEQMKNADVVRPVGASTTITEIVTDLGNDTVSYISAPLTVDNDTIVKGKENSNGATSLALQLDKILTTTTEYTGPELVMESTRLKVATDSAGTSVPMYTGADYVVAVDSLSGEFSGGQVTYSIDNVMDRNGGAILNTVTNQSLLDVNIIPRYLIKYRFAPLYYVWDSTSPTDDAFTFRDVVGNLDNIAIFNNETLKNMHEAAFLSLFNVPVIGKIGAPEQKKVDVNIK